MRKTNPTVFPDNTVSLLNMITQRTRETFTNDTSLTGETSCCAIESFDHGCFSTGLSTVCGLGKCHALDAHIRIQIAKVEKSAAFDFLRMVFHDTDELVTHIREGLLEEAKRMRYPSQYAQARVCWMLAAGQSFEQIAYTYGFAETTLEGIRRRNTGFIRYIESEVEKQESVAKQNRFKYYLQDDLEKLWRQWLDGKLPIPE